MRSFIHALPKVELHVHLVGSAGIDTVLELARRHPESGVPTDRDELERFYTFRDFDHFLKVFWAVQSMLKGRADIHTLVVGLARELALAWCFDIPGEKGPDAGRETLAFALTERPDGLVSFGLGGPEVGVGRAQFAPFFDAARDAGLHCVPHAGETSGPETIWSAVRDLGAERIGHGTSCVGDPALMEHLAVKAIPLEVCPTSNVRTQQVTSIEAHPVRQMLAAGLVVTLNTDDPPFFGATLEGEYLAVASALGLGPEEVARLAENAVLASFLPNSRKTGLLEEISSVLASV